VLSKIVHMGDSNLVQTLENVPQAKTIEKCFHASASSSTSRLVRVCGITSMNFARALPNLRGVAGGPASWRWGDLPQTALRANKNVRCTRQGRLELEIRCTGLPRRYHRYAVPSPGSERTSLAQTKSYAKCPRASLGTGRRTKILSKI